ncbi:MAG: DUF192 domain-containing protein [Proteobacteria bacterium]|nr:DUF192 domain-containing protein [Pseudomonadota bacterium]
MLIAAVSASFLAVSGSIGAEMPKGRVAIESAGRLHEFSVEIAATAENRGMGLMHRRAVPPGTGMLFDFQESTIATMWMQNTYVSLDMLFIAADGLIVNIARDTVPFSTDTISAVGRVRYVLELAAGTAARLGIKPGNTVKLPAH